MLLKFGKFHIDDNGFDILINALPRNKLEVCPLVTEIANSLT